MDAGTAGSCSDAQIFNSTFLLKILNNPMDFKLKWADYRPYWEFILIFFSMWPFLVMCGTMGYLFHVWGGVGVGLFF